MGAMGINWIGVIWWGILAGIAVCLLWLVCRGTWKRALLIAGAAVMLAEMVWHSASYLWWLGPPGPLELLGSTFDRYPGHSASCIRGRDEEELMEQAFPSFYEGYVERYGEPDDRETLSEEEEIAVWNDLSVRFLVLESGERLAMQVELLSEEIAVPGSRIRVGMSRDAIRRAYRFVENTGTETEDRYQEPVCMMCAGGRCDTVAVLYDEDGTDRAGRIRIEIDRIG